MRRGVQLCIALCRATICSRGPGYRNSSWPLLQFGHASPTNLHSGLFGSRLHNVSHGCNECLALIQVFWTESIVLHQPKRGHADPAVPDCPGVSTTGRVPEQCRLLKISYNGGI